MGKHIEKSFDRPDDTRTFDKGSVAMVDLDVQKAGKAVLQPGWKWSESVKPIVKTESCEADHIGYALSGKIHVVTNEGDEFDIGPGTAYHIEPGHDAWVEGNEDFVALEFQSVTAEKYATPPA